MRRLTLMAIVMAMTAAAAACGGDDGGGDGEAAATTRPPTTVTVPTTAAGTTVPPTELTLRITDVRLLNSEESDNATRVLLPPGVASASVTLTGLPTPNRVVNVCQARELDSRMSGARCRTPTNGEPVMLPLGGAATGVEVVQVGVAGAGPEGNTLALEEVAIRYAASSREVDVRLPQVAADESAARPTFRLTPASADGSYRAQLTWTVIPVFGGSPSNGQLALLQNGEVINQAEGGGADVRLTGNVAAPVGDVAIRVQNTGSSALVNPQVFMLLP